LSAEPAASPGRGQVGVRVAVPPDAGRLRVRLYDARGALVTVLWDGETAAGARRFVWDGTDAHGVARAAGVYYYRVDARAGRASGKLVLLR
jgi:flagellar hook assembly protein FlgD